MLVSNDTYLKRRGTLRRQDGPVDRWTVRQASFHRYPLDLTAAERIPSHVDPDPGPKRRV